MKKDQSGEVMLEAAIIFIPILILLFAMLSLTFFYYQESVMNSLACEISSDIAKNYKFTDVAIGENGLESGDILNSKMFRTTFGKNKIEQEHQQRAQEYVDWRLPLTSLGFNPGDPHVECELDGTGIGRVIVKVTVSQKTDFFLSEILDMVGITEDGGYFASQSYSECVDPMEYTSMITFTDYLSSEMLSPLNPLAQLADSIERLAKKVSDLIN